MSWRAIHLVFVFLVISSSLTLAQTKKPPKWKALAAEADTLYFSDEYAEAEKRYTKILKGHPLKNGKYEERELYSLVYRRAVCYYSTGQFQKSLADVAVFEPEFPKSPQPKVLKAFIYRELDDEDQQLTNLNAAMDLGPPNPDFLKWRGLLLIQKERYAEAQKDLLQARDFSDDAEVETYLGLCLYNVDRRDSAFLSFNKAIEINPLHTAPYIYAGSIAMEDGDYALCLEYVDLALRVDNKNADALLYKGVALVEMKRLDEGCRCLNRAFYAGADQAGDYLTQYCFVSGK